jgi:hypothetical protein
MKLYLHYNQANHRGPGKVVHNLLKGLDELGISVVGQPGSADYHGCLQHPGGLAEHFPQSTLMGPNIFVLPEHEPHIMNRFNNFVVPSDWVKELYLKNPDMRNKDVAVWPVGIDTEEWNTLTYVPPNFRFLDCLIYYKNRSANDLGLVEKACKTLNLDYELNEYGSYDEATLKMRCAQAKFAILLTDTESQGVAYMNILSTNTPCYVINKTDWEGKVAATSVPYFDDRCGQIVDSALINLDTFEKFVKDAAQGVFSPRSYILENHTLSSSASKYIEILKSLA